MERKNKVSSLQDTMNTSDLPTPISPEAAKAKYGVFTHHERMPNGEVRFRLMSEEGDGYIRTVAVPESGWQKSHLHRKIKETYIIQKEWMIFVSLRECKVLFELFGPGQIVTTEPRVPHTVYLPSGAVIHTVKHGYTSEKDWTPYPELDKVTKNLSEDAALALAENQTSMIASIDPRYDSYIAVYNNLDNLIWRLPAFFIAAVALFIGFIGNMASQGRSLSFLMWASLFIPVGIFCLIGAYSMWRTRLHHNRMGEQLQTMEPNGYFHVRAEDVARWRWFPPSAPHVFILLFTFIGIFFIVLGILAARDYPLLIHVLQQVGPNDALTSQLQL